MEGSTDAKKLHSMGPEAVALSQSLSCEYFVGRKAGRPAGSKSPLQPVSVCAQPVYFFGRGSARYFGACIMK